MDAGDGARVGRVFLTDFGLAKSTATGSRYTRTGEALGTPAYMSPEQARGELTTLDARSDVWTLGAVLYEVVAGRRAFEGESAADVVAAALLREPARLRALRPDAPHGVDQVVRACLAKAAAARPATAAALRDDCARLLAGARPHARAPGGRRWMVAAAVLVVATAGAVGAAWLLGPGSGLPEPAPVSAATAEADALARRAHALRQSDPREAARLLGEALSAEPARSEWRLERGVLLWAAGEGSDARVEWNRIPPDAPQATQARLYRGLEAFFRLDGEGALADLDAVASGTGSAARLARGAAESARERWGAARDALTGVGGWEASLLRGYVEGGDPAGDRPAAVRAYDEAFAEGITFAWALRDRGRARHDQGQSAAAIADYDLALAVDPHDPSAYNNRGNARAALGDVDRAIADYDRALELDPELAGVYTNRGNARANQGDLAAAITDFGHALAIDPHFAQAYSARGAARRDQGDLAGAIADYDRALAEDPRYSNAYFNRGNARRAQDDLKGAIEDYGRALDLNPRDAKAYHNRGAARQAQGDLAGAVADFAQALAVSPPDWPSRDRIEASLARARAALAAQDR